MNPCPTDETLGAHVERALAATDAAVVTSHLDSCPTCRAIVIAAVKARSNDPEAAPTFALGTPTLQPTTPALVRRLRSARGTLVPGARVGRYSIRGLLGSGGMGEVYEAYDAELERAIALKVMRPELVGRTGVLAERLVRESRMMAKLAHPSVITVHDVGRTGDAVFIAMELIRGETLGAYVRRVKPSWRELVSLLERAGQGLAAAHAGGIVHRDFKPENVLVELDGDDVKRVVVTDFGVARSAVDPDERGPAYHTGDVQLTATGTAVGTPAYMAPEQLAGTDLDVRADQFAFAVSAWELALGERPFPGNTLDEIRAAMKLPPCGRRNEVPARLVRVLERGLAIRADARHTDMTAFVRALARTRRRTRATIAIGAITILAALAGAGLAGSRIVAGEAPDPCARGFAELDAAYDKPALFHALAADPLASAKTLAELDRVATAWRETHAATCKPENKPAQPAGTAACLDARRFEIAAVVDDLRVDGPRYAPKLAALVGEPAACTAPAPGLVIASVPADPVLRRKVTALRYRAFDAEAARDRGDYKRALVDAGAVAAEARPLWPAVHAETLYLLGTTQNQGGDNTLGLATVREAAAVAERAHHDYIAANAWIQVVQATAFDAGDPVRALEYVAHAEAAVERIGNKPNIKVLLEYARGSALAQAHRNTEAERALREAFALAERSAPELVPMVIQGLGYVLEGHGRHDEAVAMYRKALVELAKRDANPGNEATFRERLAQSLDMIGQTAEAEVEARRAVAISDRILDGNNLDRAMSHGALAQVLQSAGKSEAALAEATIALAGIGKINGERSERYAEGLVLVGSILLDLQRYREADAKLARACEIHAFAVGETSATLAECYMQHAIALSELGKHAEALVLAEKLLVIFRATFDDMHPQVATAYATRGALYAELGQHGKAIADLERAVAALTKQATSLDVGHLAGAEWALGRELHRTGQRARGRALVEQAVARFAGASPTWESSRQEAAGWLHAHRQ